MSSESYTSSSKIIPISKALQQVTLQQMRGTSPPTTPIQNLIAEMRSRFLNMEGNMLLSAATLLDPRFKKVAFSDRDAADKAVRQLTHEMVQHQPSISHSTHPTGTSTSRSENPLWHHFDEHVASLSTEVNTGTTAYTELQHYLKTPVIPRSNDPLQWWKSNAHYFRTLIPTAQRYLGTVATSVPAERIFSKAGELVSAQRSRRKSKHVDMYIFLNKNSKN